MTLSSVTAPGPSGSAVPLAAWGTPMTNNLNEMVTLWGNITAAWSTYTPTWASSGTAVSLSNGTISGRYMSVGKLGFVDILLTMGSSTTFGTGTYSITLPAGWTAAGATNTPVGSVECVDTSVTTSFIGVAKVLSGATTLGFSTHGATAFVGQTVPMTWASTDIMRVVAHGFELA